jgi:predicted Zn-dependent peptidase
LLSTEEIQEIIEKVSAEDIKRAAVNYFNSEHYLKVVLMPKE